MAPDAYIAVLPQLGAAVVVTRGAAHAETLDEVPVAQYKGLELLVCRFVAGIHSQKKSLSINNTILPQIST